MKRYILNDRIRASQVRLIDEEGKQIGMVPLVDAQRMADEKGLDLLMVSETDPPVCKIIDFGQFRYQQKKKDKQAKKNTKGHVIKELKVSPKISEHDYQVRVNHGLEFLRKGYRIKLTVPFRGREIMHPELGENIAKRFVESVSELGVQEGTLSKAHRALTVMINPK